MRRAAAAAAPGGPMPLARALAVALGLLLVAATPGAESPETGALALEGRPMQGNLLIGRTRPGARVELDGEPVRVSGEGVFIVGFGRDAPPRATLVVTLGEGERIERELEVAQRRYRVQRIDGLPSRKVMPTEEDMVRIREEVALIGRARARDDARVDFLAGFQWPVEGRITGVYGSQRILNGEPRRPHYGVDVAAPTGTLVVAPGDGVVTLVHPDMFFSGGTLILDHGHGLTSTFAHLSALLVEAGERVRGGEPVAKVGATGRVTGPHLHWGMNLFDRRLDPQLLLPPMPGAPGD